MKSIKDFKAVTKIGAPIGRIVEWSVISEEENIDFLREETGDKGIQLGDTVELAGQVFIKKLAYGDMNEISKSFEWDFNLENLKESKPKSVDVRRLHAAQLYGSVCEDEQGTLFFETVDDVLSSDPLFINALYLVADEVNDFEGKSVKKSSTVMNSSVNSSSTGLGAKRLRKRKKR